MDEAQNNYLDNRQNGNDGDSPTHPFPGDGTYSWDTPESENSSAIRYTEGPQDRAWMEERDRKYVFRLEQENRLDFDEPNLKTEVPRLYAETMAKRQARLYDAVFNNSLETLTALLSQEIDLEQKNHEQKTAMDFAIQLRHSVCFR